MAFTLGALSVPMWNGPFRARSIIRKMFVFKFPNENDGIPLDNNSFPCKYHYWQYWQLKTLASVFFGTSFVISLTKKLGILKKKCKFD
jgi:hypothetical protein